MSEADAEALVIGLGNPLMADDGLGIVALERLRGERRLPDAVHLVDGGTWGMNLLPLVEGAERVLFLDAIDADRSPGSLIELERDELPRFFAQKLSPHQIDLREILAVAEFRGTLPSHLVAIGLQPCRLEMRCGLSPELECRLDDLLIAVTDRLAGWGIAGVSQVRMPTSPGVPAPGPATARDTASADPATTKASGTPGG